ncbi:hypothetical protein MHYP_G00330700, partial [Metynnis hypsauchen]
MEMSPVRSPCLEIHTLTRALTRGSRSLQICPHPHASVPVAIVTSVPFKQAVPKMTTQHRWIQIHHHPLQQPSAPTAPAPVSTQCLTRHYWSPST